MILDETIPHITQLRLRIRKIQIIKYPNTYISRTTSQSHSNGLFHSQISFTKFSHHPTNTTPTKHPITTRPNPFALQRPHFITRPFYVCVLYDVRMHNLPKSRRLMSSSFPLDLAKRKYKGDGKTLDFWKTDRNPDPRDPIYAIFMGSV